MGSKKLPTWMDPRPDIKALKKVLNSLTELEKKNPSQKINKKCNNAIRSSIYTINRLEKLSKKFEREGYYD